jgi:hypothetical protein
LPALPSIELRARRCAPRIAESWLIGSSGIWLAASAAEGADDPFG